MSQEKPNDSDRSEEEKSPHQDTTKPIRPEGDQKETASIHQDPTRPMTPSGAAEADESIPEIDEGPRPGPVDEIQEALFEAAQAELSTEVEFDNLAKPKLESDEGPRSGPIDEGGASPLPAPYRRRILSRFLIHPT